MAEPIGVENRLTLASSPWSSPSGAFLSVIIPSFSSHCLSFLLAFLSNKAGFKVVLGLRDVGVICFVSHVLQLLPI